MVGRSVRWLGGLAGSSKPCGGRINHCPALGTIVRSSLSARVSLSERVRERENWTARSRASAITMRAPAHNKRGAGSIWKHAGRNLFGFGVSACEAGRPAAPLNQTGCIPPPRRRRRRRRGLFLKRRQSIGASVGRLFFICAQRSSQWSEHFRGLHAIPFRRRRLLMRGLKGFLGHNGICDGWLDGKGPHGPSAHLIARGGEAHRRQLLALPPTETK